MKAQQRHSASEFRLTELTECAFVSRRDTKKSLTPARFMWFKKKKTQHFQPLTSSSEFEALLETSIEKPVVLYKHSCMCGVSFMAQREVKRFFEQSGLPVFELVVQNSRALSNSISTKLGIRHESPQAILLYQKKPFYNTSHGGIQAERLGAAVEKVFSPKRQH